MTTTITETGPFERLVKFQLSEEQINEAKKAAARKLSSEVKIHGFRPGKAPLPVVEATVGVDRVRREAIDDLVAPVLTDVLTDEDLRPAVTPELESLDDVDGGVEVGVRVTLWPTIELPNYKDRRIEVTDPEVTPEELERQIERILEQFAPVEEVDRPALEGDFVSIDVEASSDEVEVGDSKIADLLYQVGSGRFLEGIDDKLIGAEAGSTFGFEGPLPEGFGDRAGHQVTFTVSVNEVKERVLPELTDQWVDENTEFETVEEMRETLSEQLSAAKLRGVAREFAEKALATLREQIEIVLPEALLRAEMDTQLHNFLHRLEEADVSLEDYFKATGIQQDIFLADLRDQAELSLRNRLVLEGVAMAEEIDVTEEDMSNALQALAMRSGDPVGFIKAFREGGRELALASDILRNRALDVILSNAHPVDEEGRPVDLSLKAPEVEGLVVDDDVVEGEVVATVVEEEE
jgi:trigger factor